MTYNAQPFSPSAYDAASPIEGIYSLFSTRFAQPSDRRQPFSDKRDDLNSASISHAPTAQSAHRVADAEHDSDDEPAVLTRLFSRDALLADPECILADSARQAETVHTGVSKALRQRALK